jgi:hypothetical protein
MNEIIQTLKDVWAFSCAHGVVWLFCGIVVVGIFVTAAVCYVCEVIEAICIRLNMFSYYGKGRYYAKRKRPK